MRKAVDTFVGWLMSLDNAFFKMITFSLDLFLGVQRVECILIVGLLNDTEQDFTL